jgi:transcription elongation factor GreA
MWNQPMSAEKQYLSKDKYEELKKELDHLKTVRRKEVAEGLEYARSLGDLAENSEYQEARNLQASTEERISKLELILQSAKIVSHAPTGDVVGLGSVVTVKKETEKESREYQVVGTEEADMGKQKISYVSPLGEAMMGKKKGESFTFQTPSGKMTYKIVDIK